jgi:hypothetical protein
MIAGLLHRRVAWGTDTGRSSPFAVVCRQISAMLYNRLMSSERRRAHRHQTALPVEWESGRGLTRDVSIDGVYFEAEQPPADALADIILNVLIEDAFPDVPARFQCRGTVVRIEEEGDGRFGIAVRFTSIDFKGRDKGQP